MRFGSEDERQAGAVAVLAERLAGPQATARAAATVTTIAGLIFTRYVLGLQPLAGMPGDQLIRHVAPAIRASLAIP
jgi:hypothetical protein